MRLKQVSLLASASLFGMLVHAGLSTSALAQAAAALSGQVTSAEEGPIGRRPDQRQEGRLDHHDTVVNRRQGRIQLPGRSARRRPLCDRHKAIGYDLDGPKAADVAAGGSKADISSSSRPRIWSTSCPMPSGCRARRPRQPQDQHGGLRELPHPASASSPRPMTPRSSRRCSSAWGLLAGQHADASAAAPGRARAPTAHRFRRRSSMRSRAGLPASI